MRILFWFEAGLAALAAVLAAVTLVWRDWIEAVFGAGADIDHGDGSLEWLIVGVLALVAVVGGLLAYGEWRRHASVSAGVAP